MNGPTHLGIALAAAHLAGASDWKQYAIVAAGALLPDVDGGGAIARPLENALPRIIPRLPLIRATDGLLKAVSKLVKKVFGHRGILHWPVLALPMIWAGVTGRGELWLWLALGWLAHVFSDAFTTQGVPLAGPFYINKIRLLPKPLAFRTGGFMESALAWAIWGYLAALLTRAGLARLGVYL